MSRPWLTDGNVAFAAEYQESIRAHFDEPSKVSRQDAESLPHRRNLQNGPSEYTYLQQLGLTRPTPSRNPIRDKNGKVDDKSAFFEPAPFSRVVAEERARAFGRAGHGAVTSVAEALHVVNALAHPYGAGKIYYRGEHRYGYELKSRAHRSMEKLGIPIGADGITQAEVDAIRKFQAAVKNNQDLKNEISPHAPLPGDDDPEWLPIMQHYDEKFGTRLLDISSSIFAGLHFACIDWEGAIDFQTDGLLYVFFGHGRYYQYEPSGTFDDEISEFVPENVEDAFKSWSCPEYLHHYKSNQYSQRELAQDGFFLVQADLNLPPTFGGNAQHKICIPSWAKAKIVQELWYAGYTPERIVRGKKGIKAAKIAAEFLSRYKASTPEWAIPNPPTDKNTIDRLVHYASLYCTDPHSPAAPKVNFAGILKNQVGADNNRISTIIRLLENLSAKQATKDQLRVWISELV